MNKDARILIAGSETMAGSALLSCLEAKGFNPRAAETAWLTDYDSAFEIFQEENPEYVFFTAGKSGGIRANQKFPATFMRNNLFASLYVMEAARMHGTEKVLFLGSSCVYPKNVSQPMKPSALMSSTLEPTCQSYALAKLSGMELCRAYRQEYGMRCISAIASDPFGPEGSFDAEDSHVIASMLVKMHLAKKENAPTLELWGTGVPVRDFIFSKDLAEGCVYLMEHYDSEEPVNVTAHSPLSIRALSDILRETVGYKGEIVFNPQYPDGAPSKVLDHEKIFSLGWRPSVPFQEALHLTYEAYLRNEAGETIHA